MAVYEIPIGGDKSMRVEVGDDGVGKLTSCLAEGCPYCGEPDCDADCDESQEDESKEDERDREARIRYNCAIDGMESLVLACACEGIDVKSPSFVKAVQTSIAACGNHYW